MDFYISVCCVALVVLSSTASTAATNSEVKGILHKIIKAVELCQTLFFHNTYRQQQCGSNRPTTTHSKLGSSDGIGVHAIRLLLVHENA